MESSEELQRLFFTTLNDNAEIMEIAFRVYDKVSSGNSYGGKTAYIAFGAYDASQDDADCISGIRATLTIHVWSRADGAVECKRLTDKVRKALNHQSLTLSDNALVDTRVESWQVFPDPGGDHHGVIQVTALIEES